MKVSIIGAGRVGSATAYALLQGIAADEIVLIDILKNLAEGEALDLNHASVGLGKKTKFLGGDDLRLADNSDFIIITAGRARKLGETREDLLEFNSKIVEDICRKLQQACKDATIIIITNPASQITELVRKYFAKVIGMENQLDTSRAKYFIAGETGKPISSVKSYVRGGHGEAMYIEFKEKLADEQKKKITEQVKNAGPQIIALKGATCWGIAAHTTKEIKKCLRTANNLNSQV